MFSLLVRTRCFAVLALLITCLLGCSKDESFAPRELVGKVDGTEAFIGLVVGNGHVVAYVCDGTETSATTSVWLDGSATDSGFDLTASGVRVESAFATTELGDLTGTVVLSDGISHTFSASAASAPSGLYRDSSSYEDVVGGWIVLGDGQMRGAVRVAINGLQSTTSAVTSAGIVNATSGNLVLVGTRVVSSATPKAPAVSGTSTTCSAATTCSGHGVCSTTGTCGCNIGFTGATCNACAANFFGPSCTACSAATTCNGHGSCTTSGGCACNAGFAGASCNACATDFFGFPACAFCSAAITCSGHGTCTSTGACTCNPGFSGPSCQ